MENLTSVVLNALPFILDNISRIALLLSIVLLAVVVISSVTRLGRAAFRFGLALSYKQISIVSDSEAYEELKQDLADSGLIKGKNIVRISKSHLPKTMKARLILVVHGYLDIEQLKQVFSNRGPQCGLILYCPPEKERLNESEMQLLNSCPFSVLCNFRGRMVNDVLLMMLSTSFTKNDIKKQVAQP